MKRSTPPFSCRTATFRTANCRTRPSAFSIPRAPGWRSGRMQRPPQSRTCNERIDDLAVQMRILERETAVGADHTERLRRYREERAETKRAWTIARRGGKSERELVSTIREVRPNWRTAARSCDGHGRAGARLRRRPAQRSGARSTARTAGGARRLTRTRVVQGESPLYRSASMRTWSARSFRAGPASRSARC